MKVAIIRSWCFKRSALAIVTLAALAGTAPSAVAQIMYSVTDLGSGCAYGVNDEGEVVGQTGAGHAFLYSDGSTIDLGTFGGPSSIAYAINNNGEVVGTSTTSVGYTHPFVYAGGRKIDLGTLGASSAVAFSINNNNQVAGGSWTAGDASFHASLYSGGTITDLGISGMARAINDNGQVVGQFGANYGLIHAFLYSGGSMTDLGTLNATLNESSACGINDSGQVVGYADYNGSSYFHAFLYSGGTMTDLSKLGGMDAGCGINNSGEVVGYGPTYGLADNHAFLFDNGTMTDLNSAIDPNSGWTLQLAYGINDKGQIVGSGYAPSGQTDAFLLTPVPEPGSFVLVAFGIGALLRPRRR